MSLTKLLVSGFFVPIDQIAAPNLIHLSLETMVSGSSRITVQSILNMLQWCPQLETILIYIFLDLSPVQESYTPVTLPKLHSIELGYAEIWSGLVIPLHFPPEVAAGFWGICSIDGTWPYESIQHVLATINIKSVTLAHIQHGQYREGNIYLICFEGPKGSLEIVFLEKHDRDPFGPDGLLLSHPPQLNNVKTLHIMDFSLHNSTLPAIASAMHNLLSINFIGHSDYPRSLIPMGSSPVLFPHLKHISGPSLVRPLVETARGRKEWGIALSSLDVYGNPKYGDRTKHLTDLRGIMENVKAWQHCDLPECWTSNTVLDIWKAAGYHRPVSAGSCQK